MSKEEMLKQLRDRIEANQGSRNIYCFLDFDGVINVPYGDERDFDLEWVFKANTNVMPRFNELCLKYKLKLIISSTWRSLGLDYVKNYLYESGMDENIKVVGRTGYDEHFDRGNEILTYLSKHPRITRFIILDDAPLPELEQWHIRTRFLEGLTEEKKAEAERMLENYEKV